MEDAQKTILVVDDQSIDRKLLRRLLQDRYHVLEAANGEDALALLRQRDVPVAAMLLDLVMPGMDGYAVLAAMAEDPAIAEIPVIVASQMGTGDPESRALELGARDYVTKPYNPLVLRRRLSNLIDLYEADVSLLRAERDALTGLYNQNTFFHRAAQRLAQDPDAPYSFVVTDIERFKLVNDCFGMKAGDDLLRFIAKNLEASVREKGGICARLNADHFAALLPYQISDAAIAQVVDEAEKSLATYSLNMKISLKFGIYLVSDRTVTVDLMCDRAMLAADSVKG
jgi:diguanylate cyclase (GGDEF)-like protein